MATVTIQLDGEAVQAPAGANLLATILRAGRPVPHACYHPALSTPASCRQCVALMAGDGDTGGELVTTCNRQVADGLRLRLDAEPVAAARASLAHDLLLRHPAECGVCERAGECELQETVFRHHDGHTAATVDRQTERVQLGPRLVLDRRRCILCTRCVRFGEEISAAPVLTVEGGGAAARIAAVAGAEVGDPMSGNLADLCPAGALSEPDERLGPPPWQLTGVASTCAGCASGCASRVDVHDGRVRRVKPRSDTGEDGFWLCDLGRWGWQPASERLPAPRLHGQEAGWDAALAAVAEGMEQASAAAVLLSPYATNEEAYLLVQLASRWKAQLFLWQEEAPEGDRTYAGGFTIRASRGPNATGVTAVAAACGVELGTQQDLVDHGPDALLATGGSLQGAGPQLSPGADGPRLLVALDPCRSALAAQAHIALAGASAWTEKDGTFVAAGGRVQRVRAAVEPPDEARPDLWVLSALWHGGPNRESADQVFARLARTGQAPFAGMDYGLLETRTHPSTGVAFGGGWSTWLQRRGLVAVGDHAR